MAVIARITTAATFAAALGATALLPACSKPVDRRSYVERAVALAPEIEKATGMHFLSPPKVEVRSAEQVKAFVERQLDDSLARRDVASMEAAYKRLGLIPDTLDLRATLGRMLAQQIVGYFDPKTKTLYVVDGADSASSETTLRHELVHALQDQHLNLDSIQSTAGENDRATAAQAALEGQATFAQFASARVAMQAPGAWDQVRAQIRENMERTPVIANAPFVVRESLLFPDLSGAEFARRFVDRGGGDSLLARLPVSTEQVLHADAYFGAKGGKPDAPAAITIPVPNGATVTHVNSLGEFEIRLLLYQYLEDLTESARGAQGWGGDRFQIVHTAQGDAFAWITVWDTPQDAAEFYEDMGQLIPKRYPDARIAAAPNVKGPNAGRQYVAGGGRSLVLRPGEVQGRPAVLYVDAPAGTAATLVDLAKVTLKE